MYLKEVLLVAGKDYDTIPLIYESKKAYNS